MQGARGGHAFVKEMGADEAIDYTSVPVTDVVTDADVVIDLIGGEMCLKMLTTLPKGGLPISTQAAWAPTLGEEAAKLGSRSSRYLVEADHVGLEALPGPSR